MSFRISGLPAEEFAPFFAMSDAELAAHGATRQIADDREPGYPCRISLTDSRPGDELILVNYEHHPVASPYRMRFAVYVRRGEERFDAVDEVPAQLRCRTLALRAFDAGAMMVGWELVEGRDLEAAIGRRFADPRAAYLHAHYAAPGCYAARVDRL
ncbi:MAG TPA: DUF1203 domain-containing protein [Stellaceae bacterium]|nr:DUF1203 domain-containing protein [Stellaceae bacterium]